MQSEHMSHARAVCSDCVFLRADGRLARLPENT